MWYNLECLQQHEGTQAEHVKQWTEKHPSVPTTILKVAFQPTARGGQLHFVAGNIRLVSTARDLIGEEARERVANDSWMVAHKLELDGEEGEEEEDNKRKYYDEWQAWMEHKHDIDDRCRGDMMEEQLLIEEQKMYLCPTCQSDHRV
jgi:hypothetical protein